MWKFQFFLSFELIVEKVSIHQQYKQKLFSPQSFLPKEVQGIQSKEKI